MNRLQTNEFSKYNLYDVTVVSGIRERLHKNIDEKELGNLMGRYTIIVRKIIPCLKLGQEDFVFTSIEERESFINSFFASPLDGEISFKQNLDNSLVLNFGEQKVSFSNEEEKNEFLEEFVLGDEDFVDAPQKKLAL